MSAHPTIHMHTFLAYIHTHKRLDPYAHHTPYSSPIFTQHTFLPTSMHPNTNTYTRMNAPMYNNTLARTHIHTCMHTYTHTLPTPGPWSKPQLVSAPSRETLIWRVSFAEVYTYMYTYIDLTILASRQ